MTQAASWIPRFTHIWWQTNLTYDGTEGKWKALQASEIYAQREYLSEVHRNALAREVTKLGYQIADPLRTWQR
ncbi:MAG: relaxase domain-containing protein [Bryobacteraceae bacterium]